MKSEATIRRWIKQVKAEPCVKNVELYRQGMEAALNCVIYDWPSPVKFLQLATRMRKFARRTGAAKGK